MQEGVISEQVSPHQEKLKPDRFCLFIPAAFATHEGMRPFRKILEREYEGNILVYNTFFSLERPDPQRFTTMAEALNQAINEGKKIDVYIHSSGGVELVRVIKEWQKKAPKLFEQKTIDNLRLILISPAGFFKGISGAADLIKRCTKAFYYAFLSKENVFHGLDSLLLVPPDNIGNEELYQKLRKFLPEISLYREDLETIYPSRSTDYQPHLSNEEETKLKEIDEKIKQVLEAGPQKKLKKLLSQRGKMLNTAMDKAFAGDYFDQSGLPELPKISPAETAKLYGQALLGLPSLVKDVLWGRTLETVEFLRKKGVKTELLVPEFDTILPFKYIEDFFAGKPLNATLLAGHTHGSLALNLSWLAENRTADV